MKPFHIVAGSLALTTLIATQSQSYAAQSRAKQVPHTVSAANEAKFFPKGHRRHPAPQPVLDANIPASITNTALSPSDRNTLISAMRAMKPEHRENVTLVLPNGRLITNKSSVRSYVAKPVPGKPGVYLDEQGHEFTVKEDKKPRTSFVRGDAPRAVAYEPYRLSDVLAAADPPDTDGGNTGPFHRVFTSNGYSAGKVDVELPCNSGNLRPSETGNVYIGGWGAVSSSVDAGLFHGSDFSSANDVFDLLFKEAHGSSPGILAQTTVVNWYDRFQCSQTVTMEMYPSGSYTDPTTGGNYNYLILNIQGYDSAGNFSNYSWNLLTPVGEWNQDGSGDIIKRMTTVAQQGPTASDGSYWGYNPGASPPEPMFHWINTNVGTPGNYHPWTASDASLNSSQDWVGYDASGYSIDPSGYIFQNIPTGDENVESWEGIFLHQ